MRGSIITKLYEKNVCLNTGVIVKMYLLYKESCIHGKNDTEFYNTTGYPVIIDMVIDKRR